MSMIKRNTGAGGGVVFIDWKGTPQEFTNEKGEKEYGSFAISKGKGEPKEILRSNSAITGYVTALDVTEYAYQGDTIHTLKIRLEDVKGEEPPAMISVNLNSYFAAKVVGLLNAADLSKPLSFNANAVKEGAKFGEGVAERDNVFPTARQGADDARLVPTWAGVGIKLPDAEKIRVNGKMITNMDPVNAIVGETIKGLYEKLDAMKASEGHADEGLNPEEVAASVAGQNGDRPRG